ncbi:MAG: MBL fold metallo-hydrolase [Chloroflexi bacterium]|nr:MBL fold metallo-hydrolase [Chloroflexota bacterium]
MKLADRIYLVGSGIQGFGLTDDYDCHVYLIDGGDELAVVDAGAGLGVPQIVQNIREHGFEPGRVRHLLLTHAHGDHAGGAARMRAALGGPRVYIHADCAPFLREGDERAISLTDARRAGAYPNDYHFEPCGVDVELREGQAVTVGDLQLETIATPGHSRGHVSYRMKHDGRTILFGGDLVFFGGKILLQNTWDCDLRAHLDSLIKLRGAAIDVLLPGHLTFSLKNGQRHIDAALKIVDGLLVPPNFL